MPWTDGIRDGVVDGITRGISGGAGTLNTLCSLSMGMEWEWNGVYGNPNF